MYHYLHLGLALQSTFLTTHLASWGFVVAACDHVGNTFFDMAGITDQESLKRIHKEAIRNRPLDLKAVYDFLTSSSGKAQLEDEQLICRQPALGLMGHSFGGWTSIRAISEVPARVIVPLAPACESFVGRKAFQHLPVTTPVLVISAEQDSLISHHKDIVPMVRRLDPTLTRLVTLPTCDHFHFCDNAEIIHASQTSPQKPFDHLLSESRAHRILVALTTAFFTHAQQVPGANIFKDFTSSNLAQLDPEVFLQNVHNLESRL